VTPLALADHWNPSPEIDTDHYLCPRKDKPASI
jgi:hypothetical protein